MPFNLCTAPRLARLVVLLAVVVVLLEEKLLNNQISGERNSRNAETWEGALEAVESGERTCVSPLLAVGP